jgi:hypothetical protein
MVKGALGMGHLSLSLKGSLWRAHLLGTLGYEIKVLGMGISLDGGSVGQPGVGLSTGNLRDGWKGLWRWGISVYRSCLKRYVKMPCKWVSVSIGAPLGNLDGFTCWDILREKQSKS